MKNQNNYKFLSSIRYWGAATSAHQVEGNNHNQWSVWELANANQLANDANKKYANWLPIWQKIKSQARDPNNYVSDRAVDHYHRYHEDIQLMNQLNMNAFRLSIEWSRIEPKEGEWDESEINHYKAVITALKAKGIEPFVTLWHWTNPVWFEEKGGFRKRKNIEFFTRYCQKILNEFKNNLKFIITINEPQNYAWMSYVSGEWPPAQTSYISGYKVISNLVLAHRRVYLDAKKIDSKIKVGSAGSITDNVPYNIKNPIHKLSAFLADYINNYWYLNKTRKYHDFIGVNYYFKNLMRFPAVHGIYNPVEPINDMGWYMAPKGIYNVLTKVYKKYNKPIIVTENGLADKNDKYRRWWIKETLISIDKAIAQGVKVKGYLHWSLLDNFEWDKGYWPCFGLVAVDRKTLKRTIRPSAKYFSEIIRIVRSRSAHH